MAYEHELTDEERRELLRIARATLREHVRSGRLPPGKPHRDSLLAPAEVITTLLVGETIRGRTTASGEKAPLYRAVQHAVAGAASGDQRFEPVSEGELSDLTIEIAVLGPRSPAAHTDGVVEVFSAQVFRDRDPGVP